MIKKAYEELQIEVVMFGKRDVIAASTVDTEPQKPTGDDDDTIIVAGIL